LSRFYVRESYALSPLDQVSGIIYYVSRILFCLKELLTGHIKNIFFGHNNFIRRSNMDWYEKLSQYFPVEEMKSKEQNAAIFIIKKKAQTMY
jgi:hypothetical protein